MQKIPLLSQLMNFMVETIPLLTGCWFELVGHYTKRMCFVSPLMMIPGDAGGGDAGDDFHTHTHTHTHIEREREREKCIYMNVCVCVGVCLLEGSVPLTCPLYVTL